MDAVLSDFVSAVRYATLIHSDAAIHVTASQLRAAHLSVIDSRSPAEGCEAETTTGRRLGGAVDGRFWHDTDDGVSAGYRTIS
jgi:hypothetical protein